jgi:hypothetical protein
MQFRIVEYQEKYDAPKEYYVQYFSRQANRWELHRNAPENEENIGLPKKFNSQEEASIEIKIMIRDYPFMRVVEEYPEPHDLNM